MKIYHIIKNSWKKILALPSYFYKFKNYSSVTLKKFFFNFAGDELYNKFIFFTTNHFNSLFNKIIFIKKKINSIISNFTIKQIFNKNNFKKYFFIVIGITLILFFFFVLYIFYIISPEIILNYPFSTGASGAQYYNRLYLTSDVYKDNELLDSTHWEIVRLAVLTVDNIRTDITDTKIRGLFYRIFKDHFIDYCINKSSYWKKFDTTDLSKEQILLIKKTAKDFIIEIFEKGKNSNFSFVKYIETGKDFWKKKLVIVKK